MSPLFALPLLLLGAKAVVEPAAQVSFKPVPGTALEAADLWGESRSGAHGTLARARAGTQESLHSHSADLKVVVLSGSLSYAIEGEKDTAPLGPGSYALIPAGTRHAARCAEGADCLLLVVQDARMDVIPAK